MECVNVEQLLLKSQNDLDWFGNNLSRFKQEYNNEFVAILNEEVVEHDSNIDRLLLKLKQKGFDPADLLIRFVSKIKFIL